MEQATAMASSNAGTSWGSEYQVFLSFRGPDTRIGFTDVLYHSLIDAGICVFRDNEELRVGERIDGSLQRAIDNSKIYIPIFSPTYASSKWCLWEVTQIVAHTSKSESDKTILPIFYDVEPNDVKLKTPLYHDAILNLEREKKLSNKQAGEWRKDLTMVGAIKGWEAKNFNGHGELIKLVVEKVVEKLKTRHRLVTEYLVGIDDQVIAVNKLLDVDPDSVRIIQIHGMGGIGKTTLAKVIFNRLLSRFGKYSCFLEDVRKTSLKTNGLVELQKKLLSDIGVHAGTNSIDKVDDGMKRIGEALCNKSVLIVLDDVDKSEQVEKLLQMCPLYSGSRILITTRDKDLQINRLKYESSCYEMEVMSTNHALKLFSLHALNNDLPLDDYNGLSREIVSATGRLPLTLEVIGSLLFRKTREQWKQTLEKLRKAPPKDVSGKLRVSYDSLSLEQKQIFLDIACFFIGEDKTNAIYMWQNCELLQVDGVDVLNRMSLIKIKENDKFWMHDQLRDLGREIVHQESRMIGKRSRLWICKEIIDTIITKEMKKVEALDLDLHQGYFDTIIKSEEIERFEHLRYLKLNGGAFVGNFANSLTKLSWFSWSNPNLSWFSWSVPSSKPTTMHLKSVVVLQFSNNDLINDSYLQSLIKMARKLKVLSLIRCYGITGTLDFSGCLNLERLTFEDCSRLRKIDGSIGKLKCLIELRISFCFGLRDLPEEMRGLVKLEYFYVQCCCVMKLPNFTWKLESLKEVHFEVILFDFDSANSWELPRDVGMLQNLEVLKINTYNLKGQLPSKIGSLPFLRILDLSYSSVSKIPNTVSMLTHLQRLKLKQCPMIRELPRLPTSLTHLQVSSESLQVVPDLSNLTNLVELDLYDERERENKTYTDELWWIGHLSKLTKLSLGLHNVHASTELVSLTQLSTLDLCGFNLQSFPQLPLSLQKLRLENFNSTVSVSLNLKNLSCLELLRSPMQELQLDGLQLPNIRELRVLDCVPLKRFRLSSMRKMQDVEVKDCQELVEIQFSWLESLEALSIDSCKSFERLVYVGEAGNDNNNCANELISCGRLIIPLRALNKLRSFILGGCNKILEIHIVGTTESLESFQLDNCSCVRSIGGLSNLKNLKYFKIFHNHQLRVVEGLDELEFLEELQVRGCGSLERLIDVSCTKLPNDCHILISGWRKDFWGFLESYKHRKESCFDWICSCFGGGL